MISALVEVRVRLSILLCPGIKSKAQDCLSLVVANIPVVVTTMIDIVGDPDQVGTGRTHTTPFSTMLWFSNNAHSMTGAVAPGEVPMFTIREERHVGEPDVKSFSTVSSVRWNPDTLFQTTSGGTVVDKGRLSCSRTDEPITPVS